MRAPGECHRSALSNKAWQLGVNGMMLSKLTGNLPSESVNVAGWEDHGGLELADRNFHANSQIDILIGGDIYPETKLVGMKKGVRGH